MSLLERIAELVAPLDQPGTPGGVLAIARDGVVEECVPFGFANLEHGVRNARETVFYIASTSKQFVAASIALLEADGRLTADDPAAKYVPEIEQLGDIRIHHLVHHTSGIRDKYALAAIGQLPEETVGTDLGTLALLSRQRTLGFPSGSRFMYSNSGYFLLAKIVERCSGQSFAEFTTERLFAPLGMTDTRFRPDTNDVIPTRATGHSRSPDGAWQLAEYTLTSLGPGGVVSTVDSLARWGQVFTAAALDGLADRLVVTRPLEDGSPNNYAYGLTRDEVDGVPILRHAGGVAGFGAEMIQVPSEGLTVVCLTNCTTVGAPLLASRAVGLALGAATAAPTAEPVQAAAPPVGGTYLDTDEASLVTISTDAEGEPVIGIMGQRLPLQPLRPDVWGVASAEVAFTDTGMTLRLTGNQTHYRKLDTTKPCSDAASLEGRYTSPELGVTLSVASTADGLEVTWPGQEPRALAFLADDLMMLQVQDSLVPLRFLRTGDAVTGLRISVDRALGTVFERDA